ncbi:hypothetical protein ACVWZK_007654 [Bradyrhizobium sp. GM0.4]
MSGPSIRLTHKVMAIGLFGLLGLVAFGAIYEIGSLSQDASREIANRARAIADLDKQLSIEMLEARRNEKNFQQRRNESYAKAHAELIGPINRDFDEVERLMSAGGLGRAVRPDEAGPGRLQAIRVGLRRIGGRGDPARPKRDSGPLRLTPRRRARH